MKNLLIYLFAGLLAVACKNTGNTETASGDAAVSEADYPYQLKEPHKKWQMGSEQNSVKVLKMIKAWENKNAEESATFFGDSVEITMDMYRGKLPNDSLASFVKEGYQRYASDLKVTMYDWESVISADKEHEWVTVWYKQSWKDSKGVADSMNCVNDARMKNGKIVEFSEYIQRFPAAKK